MPRPSKRVLFDYLRCQEHNFANIPPIARWKRPFNLVEERAIFIMQKASVLLFSAFFLLLCDSSVLYLQQVFLSDSVAMETGFFSRLLIGC